MTTITADMVKELREATGAAVLDCKKALEEHGGDMEKAKAYLAEKGLATAQKKAGRVARDGRVETYTHTGGRVGVMVEVNCETDFVAKTPRFQEFTRDVTLQIAFGNPQYLDLDEVPADVLEIQKQEFRAEALAQGKPENVVDRIVEGRLDKWYSEACLLKQPFVKDDEITIGDLVTQVIAELQENIVISRFARFELGEASAESGEE